jgi:hypothetical protein
MDKNRYNESKVYKLQCNDGYYYIGSTTSNLYKRFIQHKNDSKRSNRKIFNHINNIGWDNVRIILISEHCLESKEHLLREEDRHIKECKDDIMCLNCIRAHVPYEEKVEYKRKYGKEYREQNKEQILERDRNYYKQNRDRLINYQKEYLEKNREKVKSRKHNYYEQNKEEISEHKKEHYKKIKDKLLTKYNCICGSEIVICCKARHEKSKKHINFISLTTATGLLVE